MGDKTKKTTLLDLPWPVLSGNILPCLPLKSLFSCSRVCKTLAELVSDPFSHSHIEEQSLLLMYIPRGKFSLLEFDSGKKCFDSFFTLQLSKFSSKTSASLRIVDSCNGLLCMYDQDFVYVYNPASEEYIILPEKKSREKLPIAYGFGFSPITKQYKVVRLIEDEQVPYRAGMEIFTLGTDAWRFIGNTYCPPMKDKVTILFNYKGALHWIVNRDMRGIDLEDEKLRSIELPFDVKMETLEVHVVGNHLFVCDLDYRWSTEEYKDPESWILSTMREQYELGLKYFSSDLARKYNMANSDNLPLELYKSYRLHHPETKRIRDGKVYNTISTARGLDYVPTFRSLKEILKLED